jgi:hypothetical protein
MTTMTMMMMTTIEPPGARAADLVFCDETDDTARRRRAIAKVPLALVTHAELKRSPRVQAASGPSGRP